MKEPNHYALDLENRFTYHAPKTGQVETYQQIRASGHDFAAMLVTLCPSSTELDRAIDAIDSAVMLANASLARHG